MIPLRAYIYVGIALAGILIAAWIGHAIWQNGYGTGHAEVTAVLNAERAEVQAERDRAEAEARAKEAAQRQALDAIATQYEQDKVNAQAKADRTIADLRAGSVRLRSHWQGCVATSELSGAAATASQLDGGAGLREADIGRVSGIGARCDAHVRGLQAVIRQR
jgi:Bacteriophage Rz lysis protein